jgi:hypothetical protein
MGVDGTKWTNPPEDSNLSFVREKSRFETVTALDLSVSFAHYSCPLMFGNFNMPVTPEYRSLTREAAARVAKEFGVAEHAEVIFTTVTRATDAYKRFRLRPDYSRARNALEALAKPLRQVTRAATKYKATPAQALYGTLLRRWGELLTANAIYELSGKHVVIPPHIRAISDPDEFEARAQFPLISRFP